MALATIAEVGNEVAIERPALPGWNGSSTCSKRSCEGGSQSTEQSFSSRNKAEREQGSHMTVLLGGFEGPQRMARGRGDPGRPSIAAVGRTGSTGQGV